MTPIQAMQGFMVIDHFIDNPEAVRESALRSGFGAWRPASSEFGPGQYTGLNYIGAHSGMLRRLAQVCGQPIYPNAMFFRVTNEDTHPAYVHVDREDGEYTALVYLSKHEGAASGTKFYQHKPTGDFVMASVADLRKEPEKFEALKAQIMGASDEHWKELCFVEGIYNRALIFDARLYHSRYPKHGFGKTPEEGRMVWVCHFST